MHPQLVSSHRHCRILVWVWLRTHTLPINNQHQAIWCEFEPVGPTLFKNPLGAGWGLLPTLRWVGSWLPTYLAGFVLSSREKILERESNRQPLHLRMGTSPLSPRSLGSSKITYLTIMKDIGWHLIGNIETYSNTWSNFEHLFSHFTITTKHSVSKNCDY